MCAGHTLAVGSVTTFAIALENRCAQGLIAAGPCGTDNSLAYMEGGAGRLYVRLSSWNHYICLEDVVSPGTP